MFWGSLICPVYQAIAYRWLPISASQLVTKLALHSSCQKIVMAGQVYKRLQSFHWNKNLWCTIKCNVNVFLWILLWIFFSYSTIENKFTSLKQFDESNNMSSVCNLIAEYDCMINDYSPKWLKEIKSLEIHQYSATLSTSDEPKWCNLSFDDVVKQLIN